MLAFADKTADKVANVATEGVSTMYTDGRAAIDTVYHDGKSIVQTVYGDGKDFIKDAYPEVKEAIKSIAHAVGCAAEHVYVVLVKTYFVQGLTSAMFVIIAITLIIIGWVKMEKYIKGKSGVKIVTTNEYNETVYENLSLDWRVIWPILFLVPGIIILCNVDYTNMMLNLVNPEWNALNYIVEFTKSMIK